MHKINVFQIFWIFLFKHVKYFIYFVTSLNGDSLVVRVSTSTSIHEVNSWNIGKKLKDIFFKYFLPFLIANLGLSVKE